MNMPANVILLSPLLMEEMYHIQSEYQSELMLYP